MFNDRYGLTDAVIEKRKTVTRRIMKNQSGDLVGQIKYTKKGSDLIYVRADFDNGICEDCPYAIGEIVAVAQSYKNAGYAEDKIFYRYIKEHDGYLPSLAINDKGWNNKMFICADLMPHQIRILDVRAERLQDITDEDCKKEGLIPYSYKHFSREGNLSETHLYGFEGHLAFGKPRETFASLIDKISGRGTWDSNPLVWVYEFELLK